MLVSKLTVYSEGRNFTKWVSSASKQRQRGHYKIINCWVKLVVCFYVFSCVWTKHVPYSPLRIVSFGPCNELLWLHIHPIAVAKTKTFQMVGNNGIGEW